MNKALRTLFDNSELVVNGNFVNGTTGWSNVFQSTISVVDGALRVTATGASPYANQVITRLIAGRRYRVTGTLVATSPAATWYMFLGDADGAGQAGYGNQAKTAGETFDLSFTATGNLLNIQFVNVAASVADYADFDNVSCLSV